jgi:hypothetical protein
MSRVLEQLWDVPLSDPVQPRLVDAMTSLDEVMVRKHRGTPSYSIGRCVAPQVTAMMAGEAQYATVRQLVRDAGFALWEREFMRTADSIGI